MDLKQNINHIDTSCNFVPKPPPPPFGIHTLGRWMDDSRTWQVKFGAGKGWRGTPFSP